MHMTPGSWSLIISNSTILLAQYPRIVSIATLDSTTLASHDDLVTACEQVGGQTYLQSDSIICNVVESGQEIVFGIRFLSLPHCFASTCDVEKAAKDLDGYIDEAVVEFEAGLSFLFESVECTSPDSSAHGMSLQAASFAVASIMTAAAWLVL